MASFRPALTEAHQQAGRDQPPTSRPVNSGPRPCLFNVGFPLSGLQDRTHTSDLNVRAQHTRCARPPGELRSPPALPRSEVSSLSLVLVFVVVDMTLLFRHAYTESRTLPVGKRVGDARHRGWTLLAARGHRVDQCPALGGGQRPYRRAGSFEPVTMTSRTGGPSAPGLAQPTESTRAGGSPLTRPSRLGRRPLVPPTGECYATNGIVCSDAPPTDRMGDQTHARRPWC